MCKFYYLVLVYLFVVTVADEKINQERFLKIERLLNEQRNEIERLTNEGEEMKRTLDNQGIEMMHLKKTMGNVIDENKHLKKLLNSESKTRLVDGTDKLMRPKERDIFNHKGEYIYQIVRKYAKNKLHEQMPFAIYLEKKLCYDSLLLYYRLSIKNI